MIARCFYLPSFINEAVAAAAMQALVASVVQNSYRACLGWKQQHSLRKTKKKCNIATVCKQVTRNSGEKIVRKIDPQSYPLPSKLVIGTKPSDRGTIDKFRAPNGMRTSVIYINTCHRE